MRVVSEILCFVIVESVFGDDFADAECISQENGDGEFMSFDILFEEDIAGPFECGSNGVVELIGTFDE